MGAPQPVRDTVSYAAMPQLNTPMIDPGTGLLSPPWQRFLIGLFTKLGGSVSALGMAVFLQENAQGNVGVYNSLLGTLLGYLQFANSSGAPPETLIPGISPFVFPAPGISGQLIVPGGKLELSRNGSAYGLVGLQGGAMRLLAKDSARVTWFGPDPPSPIIWYPDSL